jgi:hypothetical protein
MACCDRVVTALCVTVLFVAYVCAFACRFNQVQSKQGRLPRCSWQAPQNQCDPWVCLAWALVRLVQVFVRSVCVHVSAWERKRERMACTSKPAFIGSMQINDRNARPSAHCEAGCFAALGRHCPNLQRVSLPVVQVLDADMVALAAAGARTHTAGRHDVEIVLGSRFSLIRAWCLPWSTLASLTRRHRCFTLATPCICLHLECVVCTYRLTGLTGFATRLRVFTRSTVGRRTLVTPPRGGSASHVGRHH